MFHKWNSSLFIIIKRYGLCEDSSITTLTYIGRSSGNKPERVIIETTADIRIALLCQGLILMICTAILKLSRSDIDDPFTCTFRDKMNESKQILA